MTTEELRQLRALLWKVREEVANDQFMSTSTAAVLCWSGAELDMRAKEATR